MVGEKTDFEIDIANTGNNMTSYRLSLTDGVPDGWDVSFSTSSIMPSTTVIDVPADVANHPSNETDHIVKFPLSVSTDPMAPANSIETITIEVREMSTGITSPPLMSLSRSARRSMRRFLQRARR